MPGDARPVTPATDVYSFGLVMYFAGTGARPTVASGDPDLGRLPEPLALVVADCLIRVPDGRPSSQELKERLRPLDRTTDTWLPAPVASTILRTSEELFNLEARDDERRQGTVVDPPESGSSADPDSWTTVPPPGAVAPTPDADRPPSGAPAAPPVGRREPPAAGATSPDAGPSAALHSAPTRDTPPRRAAGPPPPPSPPPSPSRARPSEATPFARAPARSSQPPSHGSASDRGNASRDTGASSDGAGDGTGAPTPTGQAASPGKRARAYGRLFDQIVVDPKRFFRTLAQGTFENAAQTRPDRPADGTADQPRQTTSGPHRMAPWLADSVLTITPLVAVLLLLLMLPGSVLMALAGDAGPLAEARIICQFLLVWPSLLLGWWHDKLREEATARAVRRWFGATAAYWPLLGAVTVEAIIAFAGYPFPPVPRSSSVFQDFTRLILTILSPLVGIGLLALLCVLFVLLVIWRRMRVRPLTVPR